MTDRMLRAIENPWVDVLGHPTGRRLLQARAGQMRHERGDGSRPPRRGVALEINCQVERLDLSDIARARWRASAACRSSSRLTRISVSALSTLQWGVQVARRAWVQPERRAQTRAARRDARRAAAASEG